MVKPHGQSLDDSRTRILDAADAVFLQRGVDGARMQEIAEHAGVNKSLLHYYFGSKDGLARAVWERVAVTFVPEVLKMLASDYPLGEKIERFIDAYHATLRRHPYLLNFILSETARHPELASEFFTPERQRIMRRAILELQQQIDAEARTKRLAPMPAEQFLVTLLGSCLFPFAARQMLSKALGLGTRAFEAFLDERRRELPIMLKRVLAL